MRKTDIRRLNINICQNPKRGPSLEAPSNCGYEEPRLCAQIGETDARPAEKTETETEGDADAEVGFGEERADGPTVW